MSSRKKTIRYESTKQTVDTKTGEVLSEETKKVVQLHKEPPYVKMYLDDLAAILNLSSGCKGLLYGLMRQMNYDGIITITKSTRERLAAGIGVKEPAVRNQITTLCKKGIIRRIGTGEYEANPYLFAKGEWTDIRKRREGFTLEIKYTPDGNKHLLGRIDAAANV
jgi:predicted HTH transcriptional regulator